MSANSDVVVRAVTSRADTKAWLALPHRVNRGDPNWIAPLEMLERQRISRRHNPFFSYGEATFLIAWRAGEPVGRISAQINRLHLELHQDRTGHFGFFDCIDDGAAAQALVDAAAAWLQQRGMVRMIGPTSLSLNQESGLLIEGFDSPPALMMGHAPPSSGSLLEQAGLHKAIDLLAYRLKPDEQPKRIERLAKMASGSDRVRLRHIDMRQYADEVRLVLELFNEAWRKNWGFVPFSTSDRIHLAAEMRPILRGKYGRIVEIDGKPAAMMIVLPDLNREIASFGGKLAPWNWARLARAVWRDKWKTARIILLGVSPEYQSSPLALGVLSLMVADIIELGRQYDLEWVEFSWVLETNTAMIKLAELAAGPPCKTYRLYEKTWEESSTAPTD